MKKNLYVTLSILLLSTGILLSQIKPESFYIGKKAVIDKTALSSNPSSNSITDIIVVGDTVWLGMGTGVSLSTDRGTSWTNFAGTIAFGSESISAIGYYKGTFWAATAYDKNTSDGTVQTGSGIRFTTDNGKSWNIIKQPVDADSDSVVVYGIDTLKALPVTVPEQNLIFDITFTHGTIWIATFAGGVRRAPIDSLIANHNYRWKRVILPTDNLDSIKPTDTLNFSYNVRNNLNFEGFSILAINDSTIYAGTAGGLNVTTDADSMYPSWRKFTHTNENNPISGNWVTALGYNNTDNTIWAGTWKANGESEFYAVSFSSDGGANWKTTLDQQKVYNFGIEGNQIIAPSDAGAFRTSDKGKDWILPNSIIDQSTKISILTQSFYSAAFQGNSVWLGSGDGLARIDESGAMWQGNWKVYFASQPLSSSSDNTYAYPNPFNPRTDILKIKYTTNGSEQVTIRILDFSMHIVKTIIQNATRGNPIHVIDSPSGTIDYWDGTDQAGNMVPNGVYFYRVDAGSQKPVYGKILVLH